MGAPYKSPTEGYRIFSKCENSGIGDHIFFDKFINREGEVVECGGKQEHRP